MAEVDIENAVCDWALQELGIRSIKLNLQGNRGWPDRLFFIPGGRPLLVEFKDWGSAPEPRQVLVGQFLEYHQYDYEVHDSFSTCCAALRRYLDAAIASGWNRGRQQHPQRPRKVGAPRVPKARD